VVSQIDSLGVIDRCFFVIPNVFFQYYGYIALVGSGIFIVIQLILLVDFAYTWTENWVQNYEENEEDKRWYYALLGSSLSLYLLSVAATILLYVFFCKDSTCYANIIFITVNIILAVLYSCASVSSKVQEINPKTGLLQSAVVAFYSTYLVGSALLSEPDQKCNPFLAVDNKSIPQNISLAFGALFTMVSVCYSTIRVAASVPVSSSADSEALMEISNKDEISDSKSSVTVDPSLDDEAEETCYNYSFFHLTFALGAMYIGQLLTDWSSVSVQDYQPTMVDFGWGSVWVKIVSSWVVVALYCWTIFAPYFMPDRDW